MKRIMLRISALGTVVVLGLIAIAQAQRGNGIDADVSSEAAVGEEAQAGASRPVAGARSSLEGNPLRDGGGESARSAPSRQVFMETPVRGRVSVAAPPTEPPEDRAPDPFQRSAFGQDLGEGEAGAVSPRERESVSLASHHADTALEESSAAAPDGAAGRKLQPYPSRQGDQYPTLRPPEEDPDAAGAGPRLGTPLPETPSAPIDFGPTARPVGRIPIPGEEHNGVDLAAPGPRSERGVIPNTDPPETASEAVLGEAVLGEGAGQPGAKHLEGAQTPQVTIEKIAPAGMQVGKPATFVVKVRNTGSVAATGVEVRDQVPKGTQLSSTTPRARQGTRGELVWSLGTLEPGEETAVEMHVTPTEEGELGSVATVHFSAAASARSIATKPELLLEASAPSQALLGDTLTLSIKLSNPGTGVATGVILSERVPPGLRHPAGADLEYDVGTLKPGESRQLELELVADRAGAVTNVMLARGDGNLRAEHRLDVQVIAPELELAIDGPHRRFLEREAVYELGISNPGTAPAQNVELVVHLPDGLEFISANNAGHYEETTRAVHWRLEELPVHETGVVELVTMPVRAGEHSLRARGTAARGVEAESEQAVSIEGIAAILFEVRDVVDPIEVGGETVYEIKVLNQGTKASSNVQVHVLLPAEMQPLAAEGPTQHAIDGRQVVFEPLRRLAPKADTMYRIRVRGLEPGDLRTRVQVLTDEMQGVPVTKEESTRVYTDR